MRDCLRASRENGSLSLFISEATFLRVALLLTLFVNAIKWRLFGLRVREKTGTPLIRDSRNSFILSASVCRGNVRNSILRIIRVEHNWFFYLYLFRHLYDSLKANILNNTIRNALCRN